MSQRHTDPTHRKRRSFTDDNRAIEGLPVRLVIALVVGVAALAVMMGFIGNIGSVGDTEVTYQVDDPNTDTLTMYLPVSGDGDIDDLDEETIIIIDEDGQLVPNSEIVISSGENARLSEPITLAADDDAEIELTTDGTEQEDTVLEDTRISMPREHSTGTLEVEILPPDGSNYVDDNSNPEIDVVRGQAPDDE